MKTYTIHLIRHGMTEGNKVGRYVGSTDASLCEEGIKEIKELKLEKEEYISRINKGKQELKTVTEFITNLTTKKNQLSFNKETYMNLVTEYDALKLLFEDADKFNI